MARAVRHRHARLLDLHLHTLLDLAYKKSDMFTMLSGSGDWDISLATPSSMLLSSATSMVDRELKCDETSSSHWVKDISR